MLGELAHHWTLDREVTFLNHGSFGACPRAVLEAQQRIRDEIEREPVRFYLRELPGRLDAARKKLALFLGADPEAVAFVANATTGVNSVLRSLSFGPGDELLVTDHEYNACRNALDFVAARSGATVVVAEVPFPIDGAQQIVDSVLGKVSERTRLLLIDQVIRPDPRQRGEAAQNDGCTALRSLHPRDQGLARRATGRDRSAESRAPRSPPPLHRHRRDGARRAGGEGAGRRHRVIRIRGGRGCGAGNGCR